jgi:pyruvate kinase
MLESMIHQPIPTRAEVSDVSTAVFSGTDAVMLSAETATGAYPIKAVEMIDRVARQVEGYQWAEGAFAGLALKKRRERIYPVATL